MRKPILPPTIKFLISNRASKLISITFGVLVLCFVIGFYVLAWTEPSLPPTGGNIAAPINVGQVPQKRFYGIFSGGEKNKAGQLGLSIPGTQDLDKNYVLTAGTQTTANAGLKGIKVAGDSWFEYGTTTFNGLSIFNNNIIISPGYSLSLGGETKSTWSEVAGAGYWKYADSKLYASSTGWNVGIGLATGINSKLTVAGTIESTGFKLTTFPSAGYVLTSDVSGVGTWKVAPGAGGIKFGGTGADGALSISSGITTLDVGGAAVFVKNYSSISITGTGQLAFINPNPYGTIIILKSQGDITLTSTANPLIDLRNLGGSGGGGVMTGAWNQGCWLISGAGLGYLGSGATPTQVGGYCPTIDIGGSGGGNATDGSMAGGGGRDTASGIPGIGRALPPLSKELQLIYPGGGGAGGLDAYGGEAAGSGGRGGGALFLKSDGNLNFTGIINASGTAGGPGTAGNPYPGAGGGGGAGGSVMIITQGITVNTGTVTVTDGAGGSPNGGAGAKGQSLITTL